MTPSVAYSIKANKPNNTTKNNFCTNHYIFVSYIEPVLNFKTLKIKDIKNDLFKLIHWQIGMGTETWYLIDLGPKLWNTRVSINSDVNGSAIGTGEIKKTHIHLSLLYIYIYTHYLANSISPELPAVFMCTNIQTFVYDAFLQFTIQKRDRGHAEEFQHAQHETHFLLW